MKTNNKNIFCVLVITFFFLIFSCDKLVEVDAPHNELTTDQVFQEVQTANAALENLYFQLWNNALISGGGYGMSAVLGSYTDDLDCFNSGTGGSLDIYLNQVLPTNPLVEKF